MTAVGFRKAVFESVTFPRVIWACARFGIETLEKAAKDVRVALLGQSGENDDLHPFDMERSQAAIALVRVVDELVWARAGATAGYYETDYSPSVEGDDPLVHVINSIDHALAVDDEETAVLFGFVSSPLRLGGYSPDSAPAPGTFLAEVQELREVTSSPEVMEAVRLLVFAADQEWDAAMSEVKGLAAALDAGITTLPTTSLDTISWALTGIDSAFAHKAADMELDSLMLRPLRTDVPRFKELTDARREIEELAIMIAGDPAAIAARRLERTVAELRSGAADPKRGPRHQSIAAEMTFRDDHHHGGARQPARKRTGDGTSEQSASG